MHMLDQENSLSPIDVSDEELYPCYGCRANFNAAAAAPELRLVRKVLNTLVDAYQDAVPGSIMAKSYLFGLRNECEALIRRLFLKDITGDFSIAIFPGTS